MSKTSTTSIVKVLNSKIDSAINKNQKKIISKKLLFKADDNLNIIQIPKISY